MKRIITLLALLITAATTAMIGPGGGSAAFADNGVIHGNKSGQSAQQAR